MSEKEEQRARFLTIIAANEDEDAYHQIYADWLEEHGEYEEADRQRKWTKAKQWIVDLCEEFASYGDEIESGGPEDYIHGVFLNYENLVARALDAYEECKLEGSSDLSLFVGSAESLADALNCDGYKREFWKNWSIVTGNSLPQEWVENSFFSCSC